MPIMEIEFWQLSDFVVDEEKDDGNNIKREWRLCPGNNYITKNIKEKNTMEKKVIITNENKKKSVRHMEMVKCKCKNDKSARSLSDKHIKIVFCSMIMRNYIKNRHIT